VWLALLLALQLLEFYFRAYYYPSIIDNQYRPRDLFTFTVGRILYVVTDGDVLGGFMRSVTGKQILARCGVGPEVVAEFLTRRRQSLPFLPLPNGEVLKLRGLVDWLVTNDKEFAEWLLTQQVQPTDILAATDWVVYEVERQARRERWWSAERLLAVRPLASDWAYGGTYRLEHYSQDLSQQVVAGGELALPADLLNKIKNVLTRHSEANVILVGEQSMLLAALAGLAQAWPQYHVLFFQPTLLFATFKEKTDIEQELMRLGQEVTVAGNVVWAIDDLPGFITEAASRDINLENVLAPYLAGAVPIIALADVASFHQRIEADPAWLPHFEQVAIPELPVTTLITLLRERVLQVEEREKIFFTYPAVLALFQAAEQYFTAETAHEKVDDLLQEVVPWLHARRVTWVSKQDVLSFITSKTDIPLGEIGADEKDKLIHLEERLRERIVGQEKAVVAISNALRRSRTGLRTPNKPIGSFLFLGPTGVGKTETAKALASVFFGDEKKLLRLDMSEYQSGEALERLIGSFTNSRPGILANLLREHPYGVVLIDEFEKADRNVLNLFLQILDEGFFSDMMGKRVNARNIIFIATSNAGADLIWDLVGTGKDPAQARDQVIDHLVTNNFYKPELLNRFDDLIIFHPLGTAELTQVATLLLARLNQRLRAQGVELLVSSALLEYIVSGGSNRLFGARPMLRFIQDNIEQAIAKAIIAGQVKAGAKVDFNPATNTIRELVT
jgi:ATP-dependent Clp protease ATP-binding subunit ClpC